MTTRKILILGGARSGKTAHALMRTEALAPRRTYIATAQAFDAEMAERIARHKAERGEGWNTVEAPMALSAALLSLTEGAALVDCLTLWLSNLLLAETDIDAAAEAFVAALDRAAVPVVIVSNEVGLGIVPDTPLGRAFRDRQGWLNQRIAQIADDVILVAAGLPLTLKPQS